MNSRSSLSLLLLSFAGIGCASGASAVRPDPVVPECATTTASTSAAADVGTKTSLPAVTEMQAVGSQDRNSEDSAASQAKMVPTTERPVADFPDRQSVEALDRLARTTPVGMGEHAATITLPSDEYFDAGSAKLNEPARWRLDDIAHALAAQSGRTIAVRAYTDSLGDHSESLRLSQDRAAAFREYLVARGVPGDVVRAEGMGAEHPAADNATAAGRASNRRIEIVIEVNHDSVSRK
jgi:outer membrane protein OmpA-like peptidoglycan-associated protein